MGAHINQILIHGAESITAKMVYLPSSASIHINVGGIEVDAFADYGTLLQKRFEAIVKAIGAVNEAFDEKDRRAAEESERERRRADAAVAFQRPICSAIELADALAKAGIVPEAAE